MGWGEHQGLIEIEAASRTFRLNSPRTDDGRMYSLGSFDDLPYIVTTQSKGTQGLAMALFFCQRLCLRLAWAKAHNCSGLQGLSHLPTDVCILCQTQGIQDVVGAFFLFCFFWRVAVLDFKFSIPS